ncbi:MAG: alpha/beta hydrolase [Bacteroidales bacterium]|nr:alpha/beta hydrolase [Bacteroidales bacterium]
MNVVSFQNHKISYTVDGQGECIVLLHGFPMDHRVWADFKSSFTPRFKVISIDLPGFGQSEMIHKNHSMTLMAEVVNVVLTTEKIEKCMLLGHSMGGYVSLEFASQFPEMLKGLILLHSQAAADDENARTNRDTSIEAVKENKTAYINPFINGLFSDGFIANQPDSVNFIKEISHSQEVEAIVAALAGMRDRADQTDLLKRIQVPVLFILGKEDKRMPYIKIMSQAALPAHAELLILDKVAHFGFMENPQIVGMTIGQFIEKCFQ